MALYQWSHDDSVSLVNEQIMNNKALVQLQAFIVFCVGALLVSIIVISTQSLPAIRFLFEAHTFGPMSEEILKFATSYALISYINFNLSPLPLLGTGFGILEAVRHAQVYRGVGGWAIATHIVLGIVMTFLLYKAVNEKSRPMKITLYVLALVVPILLHLFYNIIIVMFSF